MSGTPSSAEPLLVVRGLEKRFPVERAVGGGPGWVRAVDGLDLELHRGETLGLVGESGCGKSTVARALLRLVEPTGGTIRFDGQDVRAMDRAALRRFRRRAQLVFQDATGALDPRLTAGAMLREVLEVHGLARDRVPGRVRELLEQVGLGACDAGSFPHEFSGGQRQRVGIARALAVEPELLVLDEPVGALDVSVRAQVINLLQDLRARLGLTYLFIAHDLSLVRHFCDRVVVMFAGRALEVVGARDLDRVAAHPYTRTLIDATPGLARSRRRSGRSESGSGSVVAGPPPEEGCPWAHRCSDPRKDDSCRRVQPLLEGPSVGHRVACHKARPGVETGA